MRPIAVKISMFYDLTSPPDPLSTTAALWRGGEKRFLAPFFLEFRGEGLGMRGLSFNHYEFIYTNLTGVGHTAVCPYKF